MKLNFQNKMLHKAFSFPLWLTICCCLWISACSSSRITHSTDRAPAVDFSQYQSFVVVDYYRFRNDKYPVVNSELSRQRMARLITEALEGKGLLPASEAAAAQLHVKFRMDLQTQQEFQQSFNNNWGWTGWRSYPFYPATVNTYQRQYEELTLVVDIVDAQSGRLLWQGWAFAEIDKKRKKLPALQAAIVARLFAEYPYPAAKK
ncbi:DUF4136 domain-containing protein [Thermonema rossianum]|uniref:DUF4136 domain-containing protein n=1 Tax=Thermonema rossianum TaxID=55505 RepID=UPI00056EEC9C|nr:DUF4136 domain-containing protein [Thermonema rossianum]